MTAKALEENYDLLDKLKAVRLHGLKEREESAQQQRMLLRDSVVQLREPNPRPATSPASTTQPTFKIGDVQGFPYVAEHGPTKPGTGHMSGQASDAFYSLLKDASKRPDVATRDATVVKAAKVVAEDFAKKHGVSKQGSHDGLLSTALREVRAQAAFASREIGEKLGLGPVSSTVIGHSLERALEREGFKVFVNHALDKSADLFKSTPSSVAVATGMRHSAESTLSKSMNWLASHGVTRDGLKEAIGKHAGKLAIVAEISRHPEVVQKVAHSLSKSDGIVSGAMLLVNDSEFRKAVGTLTLSAGETIASVNKGAGSIAILAGSALRGDSTEDTARHAFRAALTVLGGAVGGVAGAGVASVATGTVGAIAGGWLAEKLLSVYDRVMGNTPKEPTKTVDHQEQKDSANVIANRVATRMKEEEKTLAPGGAGPALADRGREMERELSLSRKPSNAKA